MKHQELNDKFRLNRKIGLLLLLEGYKQSMVAQKVGINRSHLNRILQAQVDTSASTFLQLLELVDIRVEEQMDQRISELTRLRMRVHEKN